MAVLEKQNVKILNAKRNQMYIDSTWNNGKDVFAKYFLFTLILMLYTKAN